MAAAQMILHSYSQEEANFYSEQAQEFARQGLLDLEKKFSENLMNPDDFLSESDKGKRLGFEEVQAKIKCGDFISTTLAKEVSDLIAQSKESEDFDSMDPMLHSANLITEYPEGQTGVLIQSAAHTPDEDNLKTCQEGGVYQAFVTLNLDVKVSKQQENGKAWVCHGHSEEKICDNKTEADRYRKQRLENLQRNKNIIADSIRQGVLKGGLFSSKREVSFSYEHVEGYKCSNCKQIEKSIEKVHEEDRWVAEDETFYQNLLRNPDCKLIGEQITGYGETKSIDGTPIYRDVWGKKLCFNCGLNSQSNCQKLRDAGGVLFSKRCLKENAQGQCESWEKIFDMGGCKFKSQQIVTRNNEIWGLNEAFDATYERGKDFGEIFSTMSTLSGFREDISALDENLYFDTRIFSGKPFVCKKNYFNNAFFDCCGELRGGLIALKVIDCDSNEKYLQKAREQGQAVWVGKKKSFSVDGWSESNCYCVFPSKLARIVQEHVRKTIPEYRKDQPWGTFKEPDCAGITLEQLISLNFEEIDLSEVLQDIKQNVSQKQLGKRLNQAIAGLSEDGLLKKAEEASQYYQKNSLDGLK